MAKTIKIKSNYFFITRKNNIERKKRDKDKNKRGRLEGLTNKLTWIISKKIEDQKNI